MNCPSCNAVLPSDAQYCIECGAAVGVASVGPTLRLDAPPWDCRCAHCAALNPRVARFCLNCGRALADAPVLAEPQRPPRPKPKLHGMIVGMGLIGLAFLLLTRKFVPGIFILAGILGFIISLMQRRPWAGLQSLVWMFGLTFLFANPRIFLPGMFILLGLSLVLSLLLPPKSRGW